VSLSTLLPRNDAIVTVPDKSFPRTLAYYVSCIHIELPSIIPVCFVQLLLGGSTYIITAAILSHFMRKYSTIQVYSMELHSRLFSLYCHVLATGFNIRALAETLKSLCLKILSSATMKEDIRIEIEKLYKDLFSTFSSKKVCGLTAPALPDGADALVEAFKVSCV
jgi:hypothetical protein